MAETVHGLGVLEQWIAFRASFIMALSALSKEQAGHGAPEGSRSVCVRLHCLSCLQGMQVGF